jgi:hypothetical protein
MRPIHFLGILAASVLAACGAMQASPQGYADNKTVTTAARPVIVELYTSEGCSSCPPADKELEFLSKQQPVTNAEIIPLAFHVDYWDGPKWRDRFSSPLFTQRQQLYVRQLKLETAYTPQLIVSGRKDMTGTDVNKALLAILESLKAPSGVLTAATSDGIRAKIDVTDLPEHDLSTIFLAVTEDGIASKVNGGENAGTKFRHMAVVRALKPVAFVPVGAASVSADVELPVLPEWKKENLQYVAFVQENSTRRIIAAGRIAR